MFPYMLLLLLLLLLLSQDSMVMGSDYYETLEECEYVPGCLPMGLGDGTVVRRAIIDKNARIGEGVWLSPVLLVFCLW